MFSDYDNINYSSEIILDHKQSGKNERNHQKKAEQHQQIVYVKKV